MEAKKTPQANLENKKNIFLEIGFTIAIAVVFLAFEWKTSVPETSDFMTVQSDIIEMEEYIPITQHSRSLPPPPPPLLSFTEISLIDDTTLEDGIELSEADEGTTISTVPSLGDIGPYDDESTGEEVLPFLPIEDMPQFNGNVQQWIAKHVKYPTIAAENNIQGKVYVQFVVEKDGSVSNVRVARGVDASLDKEAVRVIQSMPKWKPGLQRHKPVRVSYTLPIAFQLAN